ncbi:hypothetical protein BO78DRAFT_379956 [Aspergillus sclerotiicarbonarius CBS 121057]|uniref:Uncharacterized protein n=1 Tax=Aspergillus sclerotiicarbonarius (strain CBS 121057 / IBT 28362) TaxID=1448318 RepID=A0A319DTG3_ASPSB|nr:hypothetical protein BO78DRAFT_379956 [Aspergillus sclerotiicarbonarius CBS 121057]
METCQGGRSTEIQERVVKHSDGVGCRTTPDHKYCTGNQITHHCNGKVNGLH